MDKQACCPGSLATYTAAELGRMPPGQLAGTVVRTCAAQPGVYHTFPATPGSRRIDLAGGTGP